MDVQRTQAWDVEERLWQDVAVGSRDAQIRLQLS